MSTCQEIVLNLTQEEPLHVELSPDDLARIDRLVARNIYRGYEAFVRAAVAAELAAHPVDPQPSPRNAFQPGLGLTSIRFC